MTSTPTWPTGPVYDPVPTLPPDPTAPEPAAPADPPEGAIPLAVETVQTCDDDCDHLQCRVAKVGAREILRMIGEDYDTLPREHQQHYETVATNVMAAMSEALIEWGAVTVPEQQP